MLIDGVGARKAGKISEWERLISAQTVFQSRFPEAVLVGGTAAACRVAALHAGHRISIDADYVLPDLKKRFVAVLKKLEEEAGWSTNRLEPPVLILGHFQGVRTGIRQLMRKAPLETAVVRGFRVPTIGEMLRIKACLIVRRNTTRDFIDFAALFDHLGVANSLRALDSLDTLYPQEGESSITQQLALQLAEPKPWDLSETDLTRYKSLKGPYTDWNAVKQRAYTAGQKIILQRLKNSGGK
ncbi:MAG: hypothetical protein HYU99_02955 [Deltaproteobacteria bacterium]|nr:hypothetical protein [Deltaproteobacteria bacterium]